MLLWQRYTNRGTPIIWLWYTKQRKRKTNSKHHKRRLLACVEKCVREQITKRVHPFLKLYRIWKHVTDCYVQTQWVKSERVKCHKTYKLSINQYISKYAISRENRKTHKLKHHKIKQEGNIYKIKRVRRPFQTCSITICKGTGCK